MDIIIYGAGYYGKKIQEKILKYPEINIIGYIDEFKKGKIGDYPIFGMDEIKEKKTIILITLTDWWQVLSIYRKLKHRGFFNIYFYLHKNYCFKNDFLRYECIKLNKITEKTLMYVEMHLVDYCNLNCKGCAHFSALFEKKSPDIDKRIEDVKILSKVVDDIIIFNMMGGEPLLNNELKDYIRKIREILPNTELQLITNGLLIPTLDESILKCIVENGVTVGISEYEPTHRIIDKIKKKLEEYHIDYFIREYDKKQKFIKPLSLTKESKYSYTCISSGCVNIWEGKISCCPTLMYIDRLNEYFKVNFPNQGIIELNENLDGIYLIEELTKRVSLCDYCVNCEVEWDRCGNIITLEDFVTKE